MLNLFFKETVRYTILNIEMLDFRVVLMEQVIS